MRAVKPIRTGRQVINTGTIYWFAIFMDINHLVDYLSREKHKPETLT